ncbi:hypothetical protein GCM10011515_08960 [Tsuneonella deserti]|uniref:Predicted 3'-5' exonuclease PolB-like domain-containing protein n=1 Tax=Tsuneonella deserti TaxID=2035528 RepID=A0ABQ1S726_9SPHN|nr:hypothetical protein [Tsuneonella deserti]GGD91500.1 hypothetical protein GCM10011515_08960 [Tsuneonella deserti]
MFKPNNDNHSGATHFVVLDCEFLKDLPLYERYRRADPDPARCRWPMKRVVSASVMALEVQGSELTVTAFKSFSGASEDRLLVQLFAFLAERPRHKLCTYGGVATDVPVLRVAAMEHGLKLPLQLRYSDRSRHVHLDLAIAMKGGEGDYAHMSEVATRLRVPCKLAGHAGSVPQLFSRGNFRAIEALSEVDIISTGFILASYLGVQGEILSAKAAQLGIIRYVRPLRGRARYAELLGNVADRLRREINQELNTWMARVA